MLKRCGNEIVEIPGKDSRNAPQQPTSVLRLAVGCKVLLNRNLWVAAGNLNYMFQEVRLEYDCLKQ